MRPSCCSHCCSDAALLSRGGKLSTLCDAARCAYPGRRGCRQRSDGLEGGGAQSTRARRLWPLLPPSLRSVPRTDSTELSSWATAGRSSAAVRAPQSTPFATCYDSTTTRSTASRGTSAAGPRCGSSRTGRAPQPLALDPSVAPSPLSHLESARVSSFEPAASLHSQKKSVRLLPSTHRCVELLRKYPHRWAAEDDGGEGLPVLVAIPYLFLGEQHYQRYGTHRGGTRLCYTTPLTHTHRASHSECRGGPLRSWRCGL